MARGVVTRVLSVRCNDTELALCAQFLESNGYMLETSSDIIKSIIGIVAQQAASQGIQPMSLQDAREFLVQNFGGAGTHRNLRTYEQNAFSQRNQQVQVNIGVSAQPRTSSGTSITGEDIIEYTKWLGQNNLTSEQVSFDEFKRRQKEAQQQEISRTVAAYAQVYTAPVPHTTLEDTQQGVDVGVGDDADVIPAGCDPSLPIAVNDSPEELNAKARERQQRERDEREALEKFNAEVMQQLAGDGGANE